MVCVADSADVSTYKYEGPQETKVSKQPCTVRLSSNDHPKMGGLISQLLDFKTRCFEVAWSPLGIGWCGNRLNSVDSTEFSLS